ncbi:MAG: tripartite tricarboxylate transporter substrate binding protein BugD [Xanthobacteraceae bacterium]|nr:tripartite tricarboxylate transporter substrate binding protein BugD [Xanthobacteraceae bacterium]
MTRWLGVVAAVALTATGALAQPDASRPITLIVPFPAGGPSDALARALAQGMSTHLKQTVVVENVSGASGVIGLVRLTKAAPDGLTFGFGTIGTHVANAALFKQLPYDPLADFEPVGLAGTAPTMLAGKPSLAAANLKEFMAYAEASPGKVTYGSAGIGSISHFACVVLFSALKANITHVPYRGVAPAMNDLMGGHIDVMCDQTTTALPQVTGGKIKALAMLTDRKLPQLPAVGTAAEAGYRDVNVRAWNAFFLPKATPGAVVQRFNDALRAAAGDTALQRQMAAVGVDLPQADALAPGTVKELIAQGLARDVPALKARGEFLD